MQGRPPSTAGSKIKAALAGLRIREPYTIPLANIECEMVLLGSTRLDALEVSAVRMLDEQGRDRATDAEGYSLAIAKNILAASCVVPATDTPIDDVAGWGELPSEALSAAWRALQDLRAKHDPLSAAGAARLTKEDYAAIREAIAEKKTALLLSFGLPRLCSYLLITDALQLTSPTPRSSSGDTSPAS